MIYFIRKDDVWTASKEGVKENLEKTDCNLKEHCIQVQDKCDITSINKKEIKREIINKVINEFDENYQISKTKLEELLNAKFIKI